MKFQKFTHKSRLAIVKSREAAKRLDCPYASTEHVLLGLIEVQGGGLKLLQESNVDLSQVQREIESELSVHDTDSGLDINQTVNETTPAMLQMFQLAADESRAMELDYIGTEHMLLALLRVDDGLAAQILSRQGLDLEKARAQVRARPHLEKAGDDDETTEIN